MLVFGAADASAAPTYRIKDLGTGPSGYSSQGLAINDANAVVGWIQQKQYGPHYAVMFKPDGSVVRIGALPGDSSSYANGINNTGQIVGYSGDGEHPGAFIYDASNGIQPLGYLDAGQRYSMAEGISDNGTVVGQSKTASGVPHAFVWKASTGMVDPFPRQAGASDAPDVNTSGQYVGHLDRTERVVGVRVSAAGKVTDLGAFDSSAPYSYGKALNDVGQVAGYSADPVTLASRAFLWDKANGMTDIGILPGGFYSNALAINNSGQVVGIADKPGGRSTINGPFYWDKEIGLVDLATLIDPNDPLYGLVEFDAAQDINEQGVVVANGIVKGKYHAFILTPVK